MLLYMQYYVNSFVALGTQHLNSQLLSTDSQLKDPGSTLGGKTPMITFLCSVTVLVKNIIVGRAKALVLHVGQITSFYLITTTLQAAGEWGCGGLSSIRQ